MRLFLLFLFFLAPHALAAGCGEALLPTPSTGPGPYYPGCNAFTGRGTDLTRGGQACKPHVQFDGTVKNVDGSVVAGATIQLWQADGYGNYAHPRFASIPSDPNFAYLGQTITESDCSYAFRTIVPPAYPAGVGWFRSRHIHLAIYAPDGRQLFTELHFAGDDFVTQDLFLVHRVAGFERLLVEFREGRGTFDIVLGERSTQD